MRLRPGTATCGEAPTLQALPGWFDLRRAGRQGGLADGNKYFNRSGTTIVETVEILAEILHGYPAGQRGKAWISDPELRQKVLIQKLHEHACARPAHVSRSAHGIRRIHSRFPEATELLLSAADAGTALTRLSHSLRRPLSGPPTIHTNPKRQRGDLPTDILADASG